METNFEIKDRNGKKSLWINGQNIWDVDKKSLTQEVQRAIISAYFIGIQHAKDKIYTEISKIRHSDFEVRFKENDK